MDLLESQNLGQHADSHWYYVTKSYPLLQYFQTVHRRAGNRPLRILDIGAGSGIFSRTLIQYFPSAITEAVLVDAKYEDDATDQRQGVVIRRSSQVPCEFNFDLVLLMDVLEHMHDDREYLLSVVSKAKPDTAFFVTVPAFMCLWSPHDEFLGHHRRYRLTALVSLCSKAGLKVRSGYYYFATIFPLVFIIRRLRRLFPQRKGSDLRLVWPLMNGGLKLLMRVEYRFCKWNRLVGVTAVVCGEKANGAEGRSSEDR